MDRYCCCTHMHKHTYIDITYPTSQHMCLCITCSACLIIVWKKMGFDSEGCGGWCASFFFEGDILYSCAHCYSLVLTVLYHMIWLIWWLLLVRGPEIVKSRTLWQASKQASRVVILFNDEKVTWLLPLCPHVMITPKLYHCCLRQLTVQIYNTTH